MPRLVVLTSSEAADSASASCQGSTLRLVPCSRAISASCPARVWPARQGPIDQAQLGRAGIDQGDGDRARSTARAEQHRWPCAGPPSGRARGEVGHEAIAIGVVAEQTTGLEDHRVDRADPRCGRRVRSTTASAACLCGTVDIDAAKAERRQRPERLRELGPVRRPGGHRRRRSDAGAASSRAGAATANGRPASPSPRQAPLRPERVIAHLGFARHRSSTPCTRRHSRSPINGRPRMAKQSPSTAREKLGAATFKLVGADRTENTIADGVEIGIQKRSRARPNPQPCPRNLMPDASVAAQHDRIWHKSARAQCRFGLARLRFWMPVSTPSAIGFSVRSAPTRLRGWAPSYSRESRATASRPGRCR